MAKGNGTQPPTADPAQERLPSGFAWRLDRSCDVGRAMLAATRRLREAEGESPQLDSTVLMAHVLGVSKTWLYAHPHRRLTENEIGAFESLVRRRIHKEPIAYLVGHRSFYSLDLTVDRNVLIPRPETELLVERALDYIKYLLAGGEVPSVADIGTGSGAIATAIAVNAPGVPVYTTDLSDRALAVAAQNVWRYGVGEQVQLLPGYLTDPLPDPVDVIVANLPYIASSELPNLPAQVRDYEPILALDGGPDGLRVIRAFFDGLVAAGVEKKLKTHGRIYLEIGADQGHAARARGIGLPRSGRGCAPRLCRAGQDCRYRDIAVFLVSLFPCLPCVVLTCRIVSLPWIWMEQP